MTSNLEILETRLIRNLVFDTDRRTIAVRFDDGDVGKVTLDELRIPNRPIEDVKIDEFNRGIEFYFRDGTMHDVSVDFVTWLTHPEYRTKYPKDKDYPRRIGENVRAFRLEAEMSQADLARRAKMQVPNVSRLEHGKHVPTLDVLLRVAKALRVHLADIMTGPEPIRANPARRR